MRVTSLLTTRTMTRTFLLLFPTLLLGAAAASAQSTFHGDNARSGVYASTGPRQLSGVKWTFHTEGAVVASPAISAGVIYIGSTDGFMYAIDEATGAQKWKINPVEPVVSSAAVANGIVYFLGSNGTLYARIAETGANKWRFSTRGERRFEARGLHGLTPAAQTIADPMDLFLSSPAVENGHVVFGSSDGNVYALDAATGILQWSFPTGNVVHASPAIANNTVYVGGFDSYLYALDLETGREKWRFHAGEDPVNHNQVGFQSSPAVVDGTVYVGCRDGHVYALNAATGEKTWEYSTSQSWVNGTPAVHDGVVYVGTADTHRFHALDARTGRLKYVLDAKAMIFGSAAISGNLAYVGNFAGKLLAIDRAAGTIAWQFRTEGSTRDTLKQLDADGNPGSTSFARTFNNFLDMALYLYRQFTAGAILSSPVVDQGMLFFGSADGNVYALH